MLFKLSIRNIRRSVRDYAIYFFTLIIGVSIFYVFNAIGGQAAMIVIDESEYNIVELLSSVISVISVFVAVVLALLIVYASRFLMKRRHREYALYMMLGMSKGKISGILITETLLIGIGSLGIGLIVGIGLSQLMSAFVANLFDADMTAYEFNVSESAMVMTIIFFAIMYLLVMFFNSFAVTKMKLIDLIHSGDKSERVTLRNPVLSILVFLVAAAGLGYAYYGVTTDFTNLSVERMYLYIGLGIVTTFLIFWSISGLILRIVKSVKKVYYKGLNTFTLRQISSRVNTMVFSMTIICLMLFVTICTLSTCISIRNSLNKSIKEACAADVEIEFRGVSLNEEKVCESLDEYYAVKGYNPTDFMSSHVNYKVYKDGSTLADFCGDRAKEFEEQYRVFMFSFEENIIKQSDYNKLMELYGKEKVTLHGDEYAVVCDFNKMQEIRDQVLAGKPDLTLFDTTLHCAYDKCFRGAIDIWSNNSNVGVIIVPDDVVSEDAAVKEAIVGKYDTDDKEKIRETNKKIKDRIDELSNEWSKKLLSGQDEDTNVSYSISCETRTEIVAEQLGLGAIITFLGLYIGIVFLIACGAIIALKELSGSVDSLPRYQMLRKIGVEESSITGSVFKQTGIFFLMPLILAIIHSVFGMKFVSIGMEGMLSDEMWTSIFITGGILLLIYGGYFLITFLSSRRIVKSTVNE